MSNWTKGPWEFRAHDGSVSVKGQPHNSICEGVLKEGQQVLGADYANGNLIAAAPDMEKALSDLLNLLMTERVEWGHEEIMAAKDALAKARGEL